MTSKIDFLSMFQIFKCFPDFVNRIKFLDKNFAQKSFWDPTSQKNFFAYFCDPQILKKNFFFDLKIEWLKWVVGPKNAFQSTFLNVLSAPYTICPYLKKKFGTQKFWYFGGQRGSKYRIFQGRNFFLRYGHMI